MTAEFNPRDKSRTYHSKRRNLVRKHTAPPKCDAADIGAQHRWQWLTVELLNSEAFKSLSGNGSKAFFRLVIEHALHAALENGKLIVTHDQFIEYGVTGEYVADALDELEYKGLIKIKRGRAGSGTSHPSLYTLTFTGTFEGIAATNEWRSCTAEKCKHWSKVVRKQRAADRAKVGRKKKSPLRVSEIPPLRNSEIRRVS